MSKGTTRQGGFSIKRGPMAADVLGKQYQELALSIEGLCAACAAATVPASQE